MRPRNQLKLGICMLALAVQSSPTIAYDAGTHARIAYGAFQRSRIFLDSNGAGLLGLPRGWRTNLGPTYIDASATGFETRSAWSFDINRDKMPPKDALESDVRTYRTLPHGWLMAGAIREDDADVKTQYLNNWIFDAELEPHDDPWNNINRFCNHFFDPLNNRPFSGTCSDEGVFTAPIWALGVQGPFTIPLNSPEDPARGNHFTVFDAREAMWQALTGRNKNGAIVASTQQARLTRWATVFRALGDLLHLNQDMGQPQHTRDEGHGFGEGAWYEKYIDARAKGQQTVTYKWPLHSLTANALQPLTYGNYPPPQFRSYAEFWSSGIGTASFEGKGLADYSARSFFTPARNFGNRAYPRPVSDWSAYSEQVLSDEALGKEAYLTAEVYDALTQQSSLPIRMTRYSMADKALMAAAAQAGISPLEAATFSIDRAAFDDRAELLIPRTVAYSTGLLDYFFRGQLTIGPPDNGVYALVDHAVERSPDSGGFSRLQVNVANATSSDEMTGGTIVAIVRYRRDSCYEADLSGAPASFTDAVSCRSEDERLTMSTPIELREGLPRSKTEFTFNFPELIPINSTDITLQIVYRGVLGSESDAVVVGARDVSEPTYFAYHNATDYIRIGDKVYTRNEINSIANEFGPLLSQVQPQSCVDYAQSPPQLRDTCLQPLHIHMALRFGNAAPVAIMRDLSVRRFFRLAYIADGAMTSIEQADYTCIPSDPFLVNNLQWQMVADPYSGAETLYFPLFKKTRGIAGWNQAACVLIGDGGAVGSDDNRYEVMDEVQDVDPVPVELILE